MPISMISIIVHHAGIPTKGEQLFKDIGVGNNIDPVSSFTPPPQTTPNPRGKRSAQNQSHCNDPEESSQLHPVNQCRGKHF